ncbi:MAG: hypothetical protein LBJ63_11965 [Prevotellaceae bacterium]|jgi:hypothetical protein|nr:hypothetical protein [Prevotellaceae bacterium]
MKKTLSTLKLVAMMLLLAGMMIACGKEDDIDMSKIDFSNIENLYAQPLSVIQKAVQGKWNVYCIYSSGFVGIRYPKDEFVEISKNKIGSHEIIWRKYSIPRNNTTVQSYVIWNLALDEPWMYFDNIKNDTLSVGYFGIADYGGIYIKVE